MLNRTAKTIGGLFLTGVLAAALGFTTSCDDVEAAFDCQAVCWRALLKRRDADLDVIILVVADTVSNRRTLAQHRESFRGSFPLDSRAILSTLKRGEAPPADGILVL